MEGSWVCLYSLCAVSPCMDVLLWSSWPGSDIKSSNEH